MAEAKLQKLKVTELKTLLQKHDLPQTGKKEDLIQRALENKLSPDEEEEELVDPDAELVDDAPAASASADTADASAPPAPTEAPSTTTESTEQTLTPEQQAMKARAERFGIAFNPNAAQSQSSRTKPAAAAATPKAAEPTPAPKKEKAAAIDKAPLGISEEVLAKRAAKFGLPDKKEEKPKDTPTPATAPTAAKAKPAAKPEAEMTPEQKEKLAVEEEKKRKRAEKFGSAKPANGADSEESDAKKVKV